MATNFPSSLDQYDPVPRNQAVAVKHHDRHQNVEDAIEAIEQYVGIAGSVDTSSLTYKVNQVAPLPANLAASGGSSLVGFIQSGTGATARLVQAELRETFKLEQFGAPANGSGDDAPALALAIAAGAKRIQLIAGKSYKFSGTQTITSPLEIVADGANVSLGTGLLAGDSAFLVNTSDFTWRGGNLSAAVRVTAIKIEPAGSTISGIQVRGVNFSGFFYDVFAEGDSGLGHYVKDLNVTDCTGVAPVGINAGHFLAIYSDGVTFADNSVEGGYNTSVYGCQNCSNITITGNREFGVVDTVSDVEAAIQIEGGVGGPSSDSFAIVSGNTCKHDIWVSDANEVNVSGNICRRLRLSVGNPGTTGAYRNQFVGNKVAQILCQAFGTPGANDFSADFVANQISANGRTVNGVAIGTAIYVDGPQALTLRFIDNRIMTDATTYACAIARDASMHLYFFNNEFGGKPHSLTSSGGVIYEKNNRNPIFSADCGYIAATPASDITMALGSWTGFAMATEQVDANSEFAGASATFTPLETGTYRFKGGVLFNVLAAGDDIGLRLYRTSGTPAELRRLGYMQPGAVGFCFLPFCTDLRLTAGDAVQLQYFHSAAGAGTILAGATLTQLQITREA